MKLKILTKTTIKCRRCFHQRRARRRSHSPYSIVDSSARTHIHFGSLNISASKYPKIVTELYSCALSLCHSAASLSLSLLVTLISHRRPCSTFAPYRFWSRSSRVWCRRTQFWVFCMWWFCMLTKWKTRFHINLLASLLTSPVTSLELRFAR